MNILTRIKDFVKNQDQQSWMKVKMKARAFIESHLDDIILVVGVILISLLSFAAGYITAHQQEKESLRFEESSSTIPKVKIVEASPCHIILCA